MRGTGRRLEYSSLAGESPALNCPPASSFRRVCPLVPDFADSRAAHRLRTELLITPNGVRIDTGSLESVVRGADNVFTAVGTNEFLTPWPVPLGALTAGPEFY